MNIHWWRNKVVVVVVVTLKLAHVIHRIAKKNLCFCRHNKHAVARQIHTHIHIFIYIFIKPCVLYVLCMSRQLVCGQVSPTTPSLCAARRCRHRHHHRKLLQNSFKKRNIVYYNFCTFFFTSSFSCRAASSKVWKLFVVQLYKIYTLWFLGVFLFWVYFVRFFSDFFLWYVMWLNYFADKKKLYIIGINSNSMVVVGTVGFKTYICIRACMRNNSSRKIFNELHIYLELRTYTILRKTYKRVVYCVFCTFLAQAHKLRHKMKIIMHALVEHM